MKEILKNKRYRALIILGGYLLFFGLVIGISNGNRNIVIEEKINKNQIINFDIDEVEIIDKNIIYNLKDNKLNYNEEEYDYILEELKEYNIENYKNIINLEDKLTLEAENYIDNFKTYIIKISDYEKIINDKEIDDNNYIRIKKYEKKLIIDLNEYLGYSLEVRGK